MNVAPTAAVCRRIAAAVSRHPVTAEQPQLKLARASLLEVVQRAGCRRGPVRLRRRRLAGVMLTLMLG